MSLLNFKALSQSFRLFILPLVAFLSLPSTGLAEFWPLRSGSNYVVRDEYSNLYFGNGVKVSFDKGIKAELPDGSIIRANYKPGSKNFLTIEKNGSTSAIPLNIKIKDFGSVSIRGGALLINQATFGPFKDFINIADGSLIFKQDLNTLGIIESIGPNAFQLVSTLPQGMQSEIRKIFSFHKLTLSPTNTITNIFSVKQQNAGMMASYNFSAMPTQKTAGGEKDMRSSAASNNEGPSCCCPNEPNGKKGKKQLVLTMSGLFQSDNKATHHSVESEIQQYGQLPCVEYKKYLYSSYECWDSVVGALAEIAQTALDAGQYCSIRMHGYSTGGTIAAAAAANLRVPQGSGQSVNVATFGAPFGTASNTMAGIAWGLGIVSLGTLDLDAQLGIVGAATGAVSTALDTATFGLLGIDFRLSSPCLGLTMARGTFDVPAPADPEVSIDMYISEHDEWVPPSVASAGPTGPTIKQHKLNGLFHDQIKPAVMPSFEMNNCCGNGSMEIGEWCDPKGSSCTDKHGKSSRCDASCSCINTCGDGIWGAGESCDEPGQLSHRCWGRLCTTSCTCESDLCGNGVVDPLEDCDGNKGLDNCQDFPNKIKTCINCKCAYLPKPPVFKCGNQVVPTKPECNPPGSQCQTRGPMASGSGTCNSECKCIDNCTGEGCGDFGVAGKPGGGH